MLFEVNESWKGANTSQVIVSTARSGASCGYEFELNKEYIVYAYGDKNQLETGYCERTALLSAAGEDLTILGKGKEPTEKVDLRDELGESNPVLYVSIIVILLIVGFIIWKRRKKPRL
ncbi:LPXTG cell wall anchor domain-containing protein [Bacillus sp. JJ1562]|uniref:LPXTG cell wall anchor domain-containing protein n=1 Tax=Bacillus sp. JJ1562 TaxID=3122960 RepID=UPI0030015731